MNIEEAQDLWNVSRTKTKESLESNLNAIEDAISDGRRSVKIDASINPMRNMMLRDLGYTITTYKGVTIVSGWVPQEQRHKGRGRPSE